MLYKIMQCLLPPTPVSCLATNWLLPPIDDYKGSFIVLISWQVHGSTTVRYGSLYADD